MADFAAAAVLRREFQTARIKNNYKDIFYGRFRKGFESIAENFA